MPLEFFQSLIYYIDKMLLLQTPLFSKSPLIHEYPRSTVSSNRQSFAGMEREIQDLFLAPVNLLQMLSMSSAMRRQYERKLQQSTKCMLPSYTHSLPTGNEKGTFLALDVGGSTFRVALVDLNGRSQGNEAMYIRNMSVSKIDEKVRVLSGPLFFDWMAEKIDNMLTEALDGPKLSQDVIPLGLTWSFPIEQTSARGGKMQGMGKGFSGHQGTVGHDLGGLVEQACRRRNINVRVDAIINDSSGTLLSRAYTEPSTSMGLILGTGTNAAAHLPISCMGPEKLGLRDASWKTPGKKVITNTELSMFGKGILPETRWDEILNRNSPMPDFQPLEYMTTGRYLGEIFRLIIIEAVETMGLFSGKLPDSLLEPYTLDTAILADLESDNTSTVLKSAAYLQRVFDLEKMPSAREVSFLRTTAASISHRAAAYIAVAVHALWRLQRDLEELPTTPSKTSIACNGSVIVKYPGLRARCQDYIAQLIAADPTTHCSFGTHEVVLQPADEAAILGAAVAVALSNNE